MPISVNNKSQCSGCYACYSVCPKKCIKMTSDTEGFQYPVVDESKCISCGLCDKTCPIIHSKNNNQNETIGYAVKAKDDSIRMNSSSGGAFYLLASYVIDNGGVVFGAAFDEKCNVKHIYIDNKKDIQRLQKSKYVQSKIGDSFLKAQQFLREKRHVLFTGTPCQIAGLRSFLNKEYVNLITQDIACFGVPSPLVWEKYKDSLENQAKARVENVNFRDKSTGWKNYSLRIVMDKGKDYVINHYDNSYMQDFLFRYSLRPSCYDCHFKGVKRNSDITLADFWGIDKMMPNFYDDIGVSLVMIQSEKGKKIFDQISEETIFVEADLVTAAKYNTAIVKSVQLPDERKTFFRKLKNGSYKAAHNAAKRKHLVNAVKRRVLKSR